MSSVPFRIIPSALRLPGAFFELDNSQANTSSGGAQRTLIVGQMLSSGIATPNVPIISGGVGDAQNQFGASSQLANMVSMYRNNDAFGEVWCLPVSDGRLCGGDRFHCLLRTPFGGWRDRTIYRRHRG